MKSILVPVEEHCLIQPVLETALLLGRALNGYLEGMAITPNLPPYIASDIAVGDLSFLDPEMQRQRAEASRRLFETFMTTHGVSRTDTGPSGLCFGWRGGDLAEDDFVGHYARAFDLIVLGQPSDQANQPRPPTVEAALFESGRPVLLAPPTPPATLGTTVVIAWNRSTETARTVALAMPLLAGRSGSWWSTSRTGACQARRRRISAAPSRGMGCRWRRGPCPTRMVMLAKPFCPQLCRSGAICWSRAPTPRAGCGSSSSAGPPAAF
jgi:hypothetical protein